MDAYRWGSSHNLDFPFDVNALLGKPPDMRQIMSIKLGFGSHFFPAAIARLYLLVSQKKTH
jgi:hypothetical protein